MKTERNILTAFILNLSFSIFEFIGGTVIGSTAIVSDAFHDIGDALVIGISYFLEKTSKRQADEKIARKYSAIGALITTSTLLLGSLVMIYAAANVIFKPIRINYNEMMVFAGVGVCVNFFAAFFTRKGDSLNQKAVNLHMLEDVLGWLVVLIGAIVMRITDFYLIDPILSMGVSLYIFISAIKNLKEIIPLFQKNTRHTKTNGSENDRQESV